MKKFGRYEVIEELGRGAMGVVYKAADPTIGRLVALKVLSLQSSYEPGVPGTQDTFMREARAAGRLAHPSIVTIHDAFEDPETKSSCIVMELVPGRTLEEKILSGSQYSVEQTLEIIRQVADGLDYAHRHEVIHRDLKPANILLSEEGRVKLTDFGIAKIMAREGALRTAALMGTPSYMSPEQITGMDVDARSDLFSLGIILYLMLTGQKPFSGEAAAVMFKIAYEDPVLPSKLNPQLLPAHDFLVLRLLAKDRDKRYASSRQFLDDLDDVRSGRSPRSKTELTVSELVAGEPTITVQPIIAPLRKGPPFPSKRKVRWAAVGLGIALVILGGAIGLGVWKYRHAKATPSAVAQVPPQPSAAPQTIATLPITSVGQFPLLTPAEIPLPAGKKKPVAPEGKARGAKAGGKAQPLPGGAIAAQSASRGTLIPTAATQPAQASAAGKIELWCKHELKEGKLSVSNGAQEISERDLKGKKKGGLYHLRGGYEGLLTYTLNVPPGTHDLTVRVTSPDAGTDLSQTISFTPPAGSSPVLEVIVKHDGIQLNWRAPAPSK